MAVDKNREDYRFYRIWGDMKYRCNNPNCSAYENYGGRGIKVCEEWSDYENFYNDMWQSYNEHIEKFGVKQTTLDRIDVNGDYSLQNCRWSTYQEQRINVRNKAIYKAVNIETGEEFVFDNCVQFSKENGFTRQGIMDCVAGKRNQHKGFKFYRLTPKERREDE